MSQRREYKVIERKMKSTFGFSRLDSEGLQDVLNEQARSGWIFDKHLTGETLYLDKDTVMFIFYREID